MIQFEKDTQTLQIDFETPLPASVIPHPELQEFLMRLNALPSLQLHQADGTLNGFSNSLADWQLFIGQIFTSEAQAFQQHILQELSSREAADQGAGLQINFHQQSFDAPERYWNFLLNQGRFVDYFFNRVNWYLGPKKKIVQPFPLHVDIETANTCNMNCPMCYRGQLKEVGQMEMDLFQKVVDECAEHQVYSIRLSWRGEPLSHPRIQDMIAYAADKIPNVSFLTNAFYLNDDIMACLIQHQVSYVAVSFDGIGTIYESIRFPAKFRENYQKLEQLKHLRDSAGSLLPQVRVCTIWPAIKDAPEAYYETMQPVSDYIVCNPYINFKGPMTIKPDFICQYPWERMVIAFNGNAQCCTGWNADDIILGNVRETSLYKMWHSARMNEIRDMHATGRRMDLHSCAVCRHGSQGDPNINIAEILERKF